MSETPEKEVKAVSESPDVSEESLKKLAKRQEELSGLLNEANDILKQPKADFQTVKNYMSYFENSHTRTYFAAKLSQAFSRSRPDEMIGMAVAAAAGFLGAAAVDGVRNGANYLARKKAQQQLLGYYQELSVKQDLIIQYYSKINDTLRSEQNLERARREELEQKVQWIEKLLNDISSFRASIQ